MSRALFRAILIAVVASSLPGCGLVDDDDRYHLTAVFERTIGLYPEGDVYVMGVPVGTVEAVEIEGTSVRLELSIDDEVRLPDDVGATIGQTQLIGERNVVLRPAWNQEMETSGQETIGDGETIPLARTQVPVEPDEGLRAFNDLADSLDGDVVSEFITDSADVLEGRGETVGAAIEQAAGLSTTLAEVDQQLVSAADGLHQLAGSLAEREDQLAQLVEQFSQASDVLATEREGITDLLDALGQLTGVGDGLLDTYGETLPDDIATATVLASIFERNSTSLDQLIKAFPELAEGIGDAYRSDLDQIYLKASAGPTVNALLEQIDILGLLPPGVFP